MNPTTIHQNNQTPDFYNAIFEHTDALTKADLLTYHALGELGGNTACNAYQDEIAKQAGVSLRQVKRSLGNLEEMGLVEIDRHRRHNTYFFCYPKAVPNCPPKVTEVAPVPLYTLNTTKDINSEKEKQLILIENDTQQDLSQLDIDAQANLGALDIKADLTQPFPTAPELIKRHTPAAILMFHDPDGAIVDNLALWASAWRRGEADLMRLTPALIWCKIVELQAPPMSKTKPEPPQLPAMGAQGAPEDDGRQDAEEYTAPSDYVVIERVQVSEPDPLDELWTAALAELLARMTRATFNTHMANTQLINITGNVYTIAARSELSCDWLAHRLAEPIIRVLAMLTETEGIEVDFVRGEWGSDSEKQPVDVEACPSC